MHNRVQTALLLAAFLTPCAALAPLHAQEMKRTEWTMGMWNLGDNEDDPNVPSAGVQPLLGKPGESLLMEICHGHNVTFSYSPPETFSNVANIGSSYQIFWVDFGRDERGEARRFPVLTDGGLNGWYFKIDFSEPEGQEASLLKESSFAVCPTEKGPISECGRFTTRKMAQAITYVCDYRKR